MTKEKRDEIVDFNNTFYEIKNKLKYMRLEKKKKNKFNYLKGIAEYGGILNSKSP